MLDVVGQCLAIHALWLAGCSGEDSLAYGNGGRGPPAQIPGHPPILDPNRSHPPMGNGGYANHDLGPEGVHAPSWKWWRYHDLSDREILDHLVHRQRYDRREVPPSVGPLIINASLALISLHLEESADIQPKMTFSLEFGQSWFDPRLIHVGNQRYPYLNGINHYDDLWTPDLYFHNLKTEPQMVPNGSNQALRVLVNGSVWLSMRLDGYLPCRSTDSAKFPFDKVQCVLQAKSVSHEMKDVLWRWSQPGRFDHDSLKDLMDGVPSHLEQLNLGDCPPVGKQLTPLGNHSCLHVTFVFNRNLGYFIMSVFFPDFVLVSWALLTFWIDFQTSCLIRTLLAFISFFNCFASSTGLSQSSSAGSITGLESWHLITFIMISATCFQLVLVHYVGRRRTRLRTKQKETFAFQNELQRYEAQAGLNGRISSGTPHPHHAHTLASSSLIQVENQCCHKCSASSPFRATDLSMTESMEDAHSISSAIFEKKFFREDLGSTMEGSRAERTRTSVRDLSMVRRLDRMSRVLFPSVYIFLVMTYLCKYLD